ncbi:MAG: alkaline phosphatase family protein [Candidatus Latescibacterota bacterium]
MNLLLVTVDSLRLDAVPRANPGVRLPRFERAIRGFGFSSRLFSSSSATRPAHTSLFTGLYPFEHGVIGQRAVGLRPGVAHLFSICREQGRAAIGFSEAAPIFTGLDYAPWLTPLSPDAGTGLAQLEAALAGLRSSGLLFVHYWDTHAPYGAADGRADGQVLRLLEQGRLREVEALYRRAVAAVCEEKLAPLIQRLDPQRWAVIILGDHGESWTPEEPYHGQSLRNSVLRVPLYFHLPGTGNLEPTRPVLSTIDLFPIIARLLNLEIEYRGFGRDLWHPGPTGPWLAEIEPLDPHDDRPATAPTPAGGSLWSVFDAEHKLTVHEGTDRVRLERTFTEERIEDPKAEARLRAGRERLLRESSIPRSPLPRPEADEAELLDQRLRELGYLG